MTKQPYSDPLLCSLRDAYEKNPLDITFKKFFSFELYKRGELKDAYVLFWEILELDSDVNVERAIRDIEARLELNQVSLGFGKKKPEVDVAIKMLEESKRGKITFSDIAGMDAVKEAIRMDILYPLQHPELYKAYSKGAGGGILMYGPPGCGKTFIAKATAGEIDAEFISVSIHEVISSWTGEGERVLHDLFERARRQAPSVLFFDEIDAIGMSRSRASGSLRTMVNQFLTELDGIGSSNKNVLTIGATNLPWEVDDALKRPGRFDRVLFVAPPDKTAKSRLFQLYLKDKPVEAIDYTRLAELADQFSAADVRGVCDLAGERAFKEAIRSNTIVPISQSLLESCLTESRSSIVEWLGTAKSYVTYSNQAGLYDDVRAYIEQR